ncbi:Na+/H+ antiporter NhaC family protein [Psychrobacter sp. SZ93C1]|uniref:Na+/H+ antiporter NhaC family protein n=1 Tax=Psychrobacter sp. SZ93C1 TaxID=2792058 RepID=UPI0018CCCAEA|nr:Na+/H+ antiporter NhaC family protein [Psychrobacter sp. SZ93C1]MBH0065291.1 TRAP transporter large permease subunit [Psychrobacter sp. SZ93C1]
MTLNPPTPNFLLKRALPTLVIIVALYLLSLLLGIHINAVALTIILMVTFCLIKMPVPIALIMAALLGGLQSGLSFGDSLAAFNENLLSGAQIGITYIMIGAFAVALARSGLLELLAAKITKKMDSNTVTAHKSIKWTLFIIFAVAALMSQNLVPVHIAFIPILIPPLIHIMNELKMDRRAVACILASCISVAYLLIPYGFGDVYLKQILLASANDVGASLGFVATSSMAPKAMFFPVMGIIAGMLFAVFITYRKQREYKDLPVLTSKVKSDKPINKFQIAITLISIGVALTLQIMYDSLLVGALIGFVILSFSRIFRWNEQDGVFTQGVALMAEISVVITLATGFAGVITATGEVNSLIEIFMSYIGDNRVMGATVMILMGLFITIGFGDSFASVAILAPIYLPLALLLGFSPLASLAILGASAALGDAGSPASSITLGVTAGLNADGQHDHMIDSVIPTFTHINIGMVLFTWVAVVYIL